MNIRFMIKIVFFLLFLISYNTYAEDKQSNSKPGSVEYLDYKNGFRGVNFQDSPQSLGNHAICQMRKKITDLKAIMKKIKVCYLEQQKPLLGYPITRIEYFFYNNNLFEIIINLNDIQPNPELIHIKKKLAANHQLKNQYPIYKRRQARSNCKSIIIKQLEEVWGNGNYNKYSVIIWRGQSIYAEIDDECSKLKIRNTNLYHKISEEYDNARVKYLESQF